MNFPLVSIITPIYNGAKYLDQVVESVLSQTYTNWELLLIDDGSKDESLEKINKWTLIDFRIKLIVHPGNVNKGVSATRNLGMKKSSGKYIALLDCDDIWVSDKLENQVAILEEDSDLVLAYSRVIVIDDDSIPLSESKRNIKFPHTGGNGSPGKSYAFFEVLSEMVWIPCATVIFPKKVTEKIGDFEENLSYQCEDFIYFILISHLGPIFYSESYYAKYRIHENSYTNKNVWQISVFETYKIINKILPKYYNEIKKLCRRRLIEYSFIYYLDKKRKDFVVSNVKNLFGPHEIELLLFKSFIKSCFFKINRLRKKIIRKTLN